VKSETAIIIEQVILYMFLVGLLCFMIFVAISVFQHYKNRYTTYHKVLKEAETKIKNAIIKIE